MKGKWLYELGYNHAKNEFLHKLEWAVRQEWNRTQVEDLHKELDKLSPKRKDDISFYQQPDPEKSRARAEALENFQRWVNPESDPIYGLPQQIDEEPQKHHRGIFRILKRTPQKGKDNE